MFNGYVIMSLRQQRVADQIRDVLGGCFNGGQLCDPRLQGVIITRVKVTADLQLASIYFRTYSDEIPHEDIIKGLESCKAYLRKSLAAELIARRVPDMRFFYDESVDNMAQVEYLIKQIKEES